MGISSNIAILILAAGASSRMGRTKQLLPWKDTNLLGNTIRNAKASKAGDVAVVLGANAASIRKEILRSDIEVTVNIDWSSGIGSSIACGTEFLLKKHPKTNGILVMLADQPLIDAEFVNTLIAAFLENGTIVATGYTNKAGVPALFPKSYFGKLAALRDDFGAKNIINNSDETILILDPGRKTLDVDTKTDYDNLINT